MDAPTPPPTPIPSTDAYAALDHPTQTPLRVHRWLFLISYDIGDGVTAPARAAGALADANSVVRRAGEAAAARRRNRIAKILLGYGERVQRSVFECVLTEAQYRQLCQRLEKWVDVQWDSVRYYNLGPATQPQVRIVGVGTLTTLPDVFIV